MATLLILINEYYQKELSKEEIRMMGTATIEKEEILYYAQAKNKRTKASYSTQKIFEKKEAENLRLKAIKFVNKVKEIIEIN